MHRKTKLNHKAWVASVIVHIAIVAVFGIVRFSKSDNADQSITPAQARVTKDIEPAHINPVMPKPKISRELKQRKTKIDRDIPERLKNASSKKLLQLNSNKEIGLSIKSGDISENSVNFFGNQSQCKKVCFVVDCSGSMLGLFQDVRNNLISSIRGLEQDNFFYIIMFRGSEIIESGNGKMIRASDKAKHEAFSMIANSPRPYGKPDQLRAMTRAFEIRDSLKQAPEVVYFLTDGFDFAQDTQRSNAFEIEKLRKQFAHNTKIHTIGFWSNSKDSEALQKIAGVSGGKFVYYSGTKK